MYVLKGLLMLKNYYVYKAKKKKKKKKLKNNLDRNALVTCTSRDHIETTRDHEEKACNVSE